MCILKLYGIKSITYTLFLKEKIHLRNLELRKERNGFTFMNPVENLLSREDYE